MDPQTTLPRALMLLLFLHLSLPRCRSYPLGGPGPASELRGIQAPPPPPIAGTAGPSTRQGLGAAGRADGPGPPSAGPRPRRSLGDPGGRPRGAPRARQQRPPGPAGNTQPQDDARLRLLWAEAEPDRLPQRPGLQ
ncbi:hypothetical protein DBR06_SOUSAS3910070, partial [Sousa chinensis]